MFWTTAVRAQEHYQSLSSCIKQAQDSQYVVRNAQQEAFLSEADKRNAARALFPALSSIAAYDLNSTRLTGTDSRASAGLELHAPLYQGSYLRKQLAYRQSVYAYAQGQHKRVRAGVKWTVVTLYLDAIRARTNREAAQQVAVLLTGYAREHPGVVWDLLRQKYNRCVAASELDYRKAYQQLMEYCYQPVTGNDSLVDPAALMPYYNSFDLAIANGLLTDAGLKADRLYLKVMQDLVVYKNRAAWPSFGLDGYYGSFYRGPQPLRFAAMDLNGQLLLRLHLPLFNMGNLRKEKEQARTSGRQAAMRLQEDERLLYQDMLRYYTQHRLCRDNLQHAEATVTAAGQWLNGISAHPDTAEALLLATDQLYQALLDRNEARYQLIFQTLWIDFNSGQL